MSRLLQPITDADTERIRQAREELRHLDHVHGGGHALTWLESYLVTDVAPLLEGRYGDQVGRELFVTAATMTDMAGWMAMDAWMPRTRPSASTPKLLGWLNRREIPLMVPTFWAIW